MQIEIGYLALDILNKFFCQSYKYTVHEILIIFDTNISVIVKHKDYRFDNY